MEKDLIVHVEGKVVSNNFAVFEIDARNWMAGINTTLVTDEDFAQAKKDSKHSKLLEDRLHNAKNNALSKMEEVYSLFRSVDVLSEDLRQEVRLNLDRLVKTEEAKRKKEIINDGAKRISGPWDSSEVARNCEFKVSDLEDAIKGKRSLAKMEEAIDKVVDCWLEKLEVAKTEYSLNMEVISTAEAEYPGIFHDSRVLACKPTEVVSAEIAARVNGFKLAEKERRELAERERRELAEEEQRELVEKNKPKCQETEVCNYTPEPIQPQQIETSNDETKNRYIIGISVVSSRETAISIAEHVTESVEIFGAGIVEINLTKSI